MKLNEFVRRQLSESDGTPSNNRVMLFLFLSTIMLIYATAFLVSGAMKLPEVPATVETLIEFVVLILVGGGVGGKVCNIFKPKEGANVPADTPPA